LTAFNQLSLLPDDPILGLIDVYVRDERSHKIDLGVGIYKDADGNAPVMAAVKKAEAWLLASQKTKAYTPTEGAPGFTEALGTLVFGPSTRQRNIEGVQTPGGTGAVRLAAEFARRAGVSNILIGTPTWAIHQNIFASASVATPGYPHLDDNGGFNLDALLAGMSALEPGEMVLLQASCHNPAGIDPTPEQWNVILAQVKSQNLVPVFDLAYQGFGDGLAEDAQAVRVFAAQLPLVLVAVSCSKNFGLYRERAGALFIAGSQAPRLAVIKSHLVDLARCMWSMPPAHGAEVVSLILHSEELSSVWRQEVEAMRQRIVGLRTALTDALADQGVHQFTQLPLQRGMFSNLDCAPALVQSLRNEHAVYAVGSGRLNVSGLSAANVTVVAKALRDALGV
jgi:aspartate/tyrosine/aromatic aminotransferase